MPDEIFTDAEESREEWVDVRMTDPDEGEWDVDVVVAGGRVEYVDLRIRPELLASFLDCLVEDASETRARRVLRNVAERNDIDLDVESDADGRDVESEEA